MTYDELMEKVRDRGKVILSGNTNWDTGTVFDAINASARWLMSKTKAKEATATLTIVSGTRDYTISSAIASDVDTINMVVIDTNEIHGVSLKKLQDEIFSDVSDEDDITDGVPDSFRVWNGVMRLYPTPSDGSTATIYYTAKVSHAFYTSAIGAGTVPFDDVFIDPLIYESLAILAENVGNTNLAVYYRDTANAKADNAVAEGASYLYNEGISYHDYIS